MANPYDTEAMLNTQLEKMYKDKLYPSTLTQTRANKAAASNVMAQTGAAQAQAARANMGAGNAAAPAAKMQENLSKLANAAGIEAQAQSNAQTQADQKVAADRILKLAERKKQINDARDAEIAKNVSNMLTFGGQAIGAVAAVI